MGSLGIAIAATVRFRRPAICPASHKALTRTNNFVSITGQASFQQVRDEINAGRPVGALIGWNGGAMSTSSVIYRHS